MAEQKKQQGYWQRVKALASALGSDGCTGAPDLNYGPCCAEHDVIYRTGRDADGRQVGKLAGDARLAACMWRRSSTIAGKLLLTPAYWLAVSTLGWWAWWQNREARAAVAEGAG